MQPQPAFRADVTWQVLLGLSGDASHRLELALHNLPTQEGGASPLTYTIDYDQCHCRDWHVYCNGEEVPAIPGPDNNAGQFSLNLDYYLQMFGNTREGEMVISFEEGRAWEGPSVDVACWAPRLSTRKFPGSGSIKVKVRCHALCGGLRRAVRWFRERLPGGAGRAIFVGEKPGDEANAALGDEYVYELKSGMRWTHVVLYDRGYKLWPFVATVLLMLGLGILGTVLAERLFLS